jgi:DNA-directed RNA polymerase I, II, and III subunit RPABC2
MPPLIVSDSEDNIEIADMELHQKVIPFIIRRNLPNGDFEYWKLNDLEIL